MTGAGRIHCSSVCSHGSASGPVALRMVWPPACSVGQTVRLTLEVGSHTRPTASQSCIPRGQHEQHTQHIPEAYMVAVCAHNQGRSRVVITHHVDQSSCGDVLTLRLPIPEDLPVPSCLAVYAGPALLIAPALGQLNCNCLPATDTLTLPKCSSPLNITAAATDSNPSRAQGSDLQPLAYVPVLPHASTICVSQRLWDMATSKPASIHPPSVSELLQQQEQQTLTALRQAADISLGECSYEQASSVVQASLQAAWWQHFQPVACDLARIVGDTAPQQQAREQGTQAQSTGAVGLDDQPQSPQGSTGGINIPSSSPHLPTDSAGAIARQACSQFTSANSAVATAGGTATDSLMEPQLSLLLRQVLPETPSSIATCNSSSDHSLSAAAGNLLRTDKYGTCRHSNSHDLMKVAELRRTGSLAAADDTQALFATFNEQTSTEPGGLRMRRSRSQQLLHSSQSFDMRQLSFGSPALSTFNSCDPLAVEGPGCKGMPDAKDPACLPTSTSVTTQAALGMEVEPSTAVRRNSSFCLSPTHYHTSPGPITKCQPDGNLNGTFARPMDKLRSQPPSASTNSNKQGGLWKASQLEHWYIDQQNNTTEQTQPAARCSTGNFNHAAPINVPYNSQPHPSPHPYPYSDSSPHPAWTTALSVSASPSTQVHMSASVNSPTPTSFAAFQGPTTYHDPYRIQGPVPMQPAPINTLAPTPTYMSPPHSTVGTPKAFRLMLQLLTPSTPIRALNRWDCNSSKPKSPGGLVTRAARAASSLDTPLLQPPTPLKHHHTDGTMAIGQPVESYKGESDGHVSLQVLAGCDCHQDGMYNTQQYPSSLHPTSHTCGCLCGDSGSKQWHCCYGLSCEDGNCQQYRQQRREQACLPYTWQGCQGQGRYQLSWKAAAAAAALVWVLLTSLLLACFWVMGGY